EARGKTAVLRRASEYPFDCAVDGAAAGGAFETAPQALQLRLRSLHPAFEVERPGLQSLAHDAPEQAVANVTVVEVHIEVQVQVSQRTGLAAAQELSVIAVCGETPLAGQRAQPSHVGGQHAGPVR